MRTRIFLLAGLAALIGLAVLWFRANYEKVPDRVWVGASGEARLRHFLAAERFAERMGWKATEVRSLPALDALPAHGILLLPRGRQSFDHARVQGLLNWVANGGHAIIEAERIEVRDALLDALKVKRTARDSITAPPPLPPGMFDAALLKVPLKKRAQVLSVIFNQSLRLDAGERRYLLRVDDKDAAALASFEHGKGLVTVSSTLDFARNSRIGLHDDAEFLWHLLALGPGRELVVYWAPMRLSLWGFLKENAAPALAAGGLLLALWLWSIAPRFGPVAPDAPPSRRRLLDHLRASGRYLWTKGLRSRLVVAARDAALRRIARAQPDFATASHTERILRFSSLARIPKEEAARFLSAAGAMRGADFIRITQHAQRVHSALEKGNK